MQPRRRFVGAALLLTLFLAACGTPLAGESWPGISTDGHYLYVAYQENILRVNTEGPDGKRNIEWLAKSPNNAHMYAPPAVSDDKVLYVGAYDHKVYAFDQKVSQSAPVALGGDTPAADRYIGGALVVGDVVYIGMGNKGAKAFDRKANRELWTFDNTQYGVWSTPVFADGVIYFASLDHNLYALDAQTGSLKWKVDAGGAMAGPPLYDNGILYVGTFAHELVAIDIAGQKVANRFKTEGWVWGRPVMLKGEGDSGSRLFFADLSGWVYAINPTTFKELWRRNDPAHPGSIRGSLAIAKRGEKTLVIAGSESKYVLFFDADNKDAPRSSVAQAEDQILSDLIIVGDNVVFTTLSKKQIVLAVHLDTGQQSWWVDLDEQSTRLQTATGIPIATDQATSQATAPAAIGTAAPTASASDSPNGTATPAATDQK